MPGAGPAGVGHDPTHEVILRQHLGDETMQPILFGDLSELAKQSGSHATQVLIVSDDNRHLGVTRRLAGDKIGDA